jgi:hypothetical protein
MEWLFKLLFNKQMLVIRFYLMKEGAYHAAVAGSGGTSVRVCLRKNGHPLIRILLRHLLEGEPLVAITITTASGLPR